MSIALAIVTMLALDPGVSSATTKPATEPTTAAVSPEQREALARARIPELQRRLAQAKIDAVTRVERSDEFKAAQADADAKKTVWETKRKSMSPSPRNWTKAERDAYWDFSVAREKLNELRREATRCDEFVNAMLDLAEAQSELDSAIDARQRAEKEAVEKSGPSTRPR
jgi:hypothetical protein